MSAAHAVQVAQPSYFLISVSTRENLDLCIRYGLAGFPDTENGAWTFCEVQTGDFISFLYGARVYNLYRVVERTAIRSAELVPPWPPLYFGASEKPHFFPFRVQLRQSRDFNESLIRPEFLYVGENLFFRGGYYKTHFQADQTTLQGVSEMGTPPERTLDKLSLPEHADFSIRFTRNSQLVSTPETCRFREPILQSAIRRHLMSVDKLQVFLAELQLPAEIAEDLEVLGENALPEGHVDLLLKQRIPLGSSLKIPIEVKTNRAQSDDLVQLKGYMDGLHGDCSRGILIALDFSKEVLRDAPALSIDLVSYRLAADLKQTPTFDDILQGLTLMRS